MTDSPIRVLIADDEPGARRRLTRLIEKEEDLAIVAQVATGTETVRAIAEHEPDLAFLDVQMPGMSGVDVVREIGPKQMPVVVFVTAYDEYAVKAFDLVALDYLLKPFDDERFEQALSRARTILKRRTADRLQGRLRTLLEAVEGKAPLDDEAPRYLERIAIQQKGHIRIVPIEKISHITASGKYVYLHVEGERLLADARMKHLEEHLPPDRFYRLHRSHIVRLDDVEHLLVRPGGDYSVRLTSGDEVKASRGRWGELAVRLGIQIDNAEDADGGVNSF